MYIVVKYRYLCVHCGLSFDIHVYIVVYRPKYVNCSVNTQKHCILLCNSAPSVLPSQESVHYSGFMAEDLINKLSQVTPITTIIIDLSF